MIKSRFGPMWYHERENWSFAIDLQSWGLLVKVGESWHVQILCFEVFAL